MKIGKNRGGAANINLEFRVNFPTYKFVSCNYASGAVKPDTSGEIIDGGFRGMEGAI